MQRFQVVESRIQKILKKDPAEFSLLKFQKQCDTACTRFAEKEQTEEFKQRFETITSNCKTAMEQQYFNAVQQGNEKIFNMMLENLIFGLEFGDRYAKNFAVEFDNSIKKLKVIYLYMHVVNLIFFKRMASFGMV